MSTGTTTKRRAGWYRAAAHPHDLRWWDGKRWHDRYWPHSHPQVSYMPAAERWDISTSGEPYFDVVGESYHEDGIVAALGAKPVRDVEVVEYRTAELVPEPDNPHDRNAICVRIGGRTVGYIPAESATAFVPLVHSIVAANLVATVRTRIWAVTRYSSRRGQDELKANIRLALPAPDEVLPDNEVPVAPHAVIPMGRSVQVTGEADHYPTLARYIGARALIATLHPIEVTKAKATTTIVEVRLGDERVGQLTPATSASVMPLIAEAEAQGLVTACWAKIQGSRLAAEVTLHVAKAEQVPDSWPSRADTIPTIRSMQPVPRAYVPSDPIQPPPVQPGLSVIWWVLGLVGALLLGLVPFVGLVLTVLAIAGLCWLHIHLRRQPPSGSKLGPS